jgi:hypothetical protein
MRMAMPSRVVFLAAVLAVLPLDPVSSGAAEPARPAQTVAAPDDRADFQSPALLREIDKILKKAAEQRAAARQLPSEKGFLLPPIWRSTREDREESVRRLLGGALEIITDAAILQMQADLRANREKIAGLRGRITDLREQRLEAPPSSLLPNFVAQTQESIDSAIAGAEREIASREAAVAATKTKIQASIRGAGIELSKEQIELLVDSVLGADLLRLVAAYEVARIVDGRLSKLLGDSQEDLQAARRYFAMHAALFALLVHAQDMLIEKIDTVYVPRLDGILTGIRQARETTTGLLAAQNRSDQKRILEANLKSQMSAQRVAVFYRDYLMAQRRMLDEARSRALHDLAIADNTYETVEASFQLRALMNEARTSFEALQGLETPGFDQIFENKELLREFEALTQRLSPSS